MIYRLNTVTFLPDSLTHNLTPSSPSGWYVLYPPTSSSPNLSPSLIYFDQSSPSYLNWTTTIPINCHGSSNYPTGKCTLIYQRMDDSRNNQKDINSNQSALPVGKNIFPVIGRVLDGVISYNLPGIELFCLFAGYQSCVPARKPYPTLPEVFTNWSIGIITYAKTLSTATVSGKVFGQSLKGSIRDMGAFRFYTQSQTLHEIQDYSAEIPLVIEGSTSLFPSFIYMAETLSFTGLPAGNEITLSFPEDVYGDIPITGNAYLTVDGRNVKLVSNGSELSIFLGDLIFLGNVTEFEIFIGNQKYLQSL